MKSKKANWLFLTIILVHIAVVYLIFMIRDRIEFNMITNCLVSEGIIIVPAILFLLPMKSRFNEALGFRNIKISTFFMIILFTVLIMPLVTVLNAFSMFFAENAVASMHGDILGISFTVMWLLIGVYGPLCEEFVFRGVLYSSYKKTGRMLGAVLLSSLAFGLMHMNFNQAAYAFAIGVAMVLLVEATGSIWSSILVHVTFNSQQVCLMYLVDYGEQQLQEAQEALTTDMMILAISVYLVIAAVTTSLAGCVLAWIAKNEKREDNLRAIWKTRKFKKEGKVITVPLLIAIVIVFFVIGSDTFTQG